MISYNPATKTYQVLAKPVSVFRAKRDGRNPSTGAFAPLASTGAIDMTVDYPWLKKSPDLVLPRGPKRPLTANDPDFLDTNFLDSVKLEYGTFEDEGTFHTLVAIDKYNNTLDFAHNSTSEGYLYFQLDDCEIRIPEADTSVKEIKHNGLWFVFEYCRRNVIGELLASFRSEDGEYILRDVAQGILFPTYEI